MVSIETRLRGEKSFRDVRLIFRVHSINPLPTLPPGNIIHSYAKDALFAL